MDIIMLEVENILIQSLFKFLNLPKIQLDVEMHKTIKNGQLLPRNMFSNEENYIISIENNIVAIYKPFNEKYYKPEKVLV